MQISNDNFLAQKPQPETAKKLRIAAWIVTVLVLLLVGLMRRVHFDLPNGWTLDFLAPMNAMINTGVAISLVLALVFVKKRNFIAHRNMMTAALVLSVSFLVFYVMYHFTHESVKFGDIDGNGTVDATELATVGKTRGIYLILLLTHIVLAAVTLPFILFTYIRAYTNQFKGHVKLARWIYPLWLYVAVTGPIVYLLLMPYYQH